MFINTKIAPLLTLFWLFFEKSASLKRVVGVMPLANLSFELLRVSPVFFDCLHSSVCPLKE